VIFVVIPLVVAALLGLGWDRRYGRWLGGLVVGLVGGALLSGWAVVHMVMGDRTSAMARIIFARPWMPGVVGPVLGVLIVFLLTRYHKPN